MVWDKAIAEFFGFLNRLIALFKKSPTEKIEDRKEKLRESSEHMRETGRPKA